MGREMHWDHIPKRIKKKVNKKNVTVSLEEEEQKKIAMYLDYKYQQGDWCHVPNEGDNKVQYRVKQKQLGLKSGVPDVLIFNVPEKLDCNGIAIELKREEGGRLSKDQKIWLKRLAENGWLTKVCEGADEAIDWLEGLID